MLIMVDTGATLSLVSKALWQDLGEPTLQRSGQGLVSADGSDLKCLGSVVLSVSVGKKT